MLTDSQLAALAAEVDHQLASLQTIPTGRVRGLERGLEAEGGLPDAPPQRELIEQITGQPFETFWQQLPPEERTRLTAAHRQRYYARANYLYREDIRNLHFARAIALCELPNLLHAVDAAFNAHDPAAVEFADSVTKFLNDFGLTREAQRLIERAQAAAAEEGSPAWYLAQLGYGERLLDSGQVADAAGVFEAVLDWLGDAPSYERAQMLRMLGRCFAEGGRPDLAAERHREGLAVVGKLEQSEGVKRQTGMLHTNLADVLMVLGQYTEAQSQYKAGLEIDRELEDVRGQGVSLGQLGTLAMLEGNLAEALTSYQATLKLFQQLGEPAMEAVAWHQLGQVFEEAQQWDDAERHYREAARLKEKHGWITGRNGAVGSWNELATVNRLAGKPEAAELWYRRAIAAQRSGGDRAGLSLTLNNLADLLLTQPERLPEARQLAEEALAIKKMLDPGAAEIWTTYNILAEIAEKEGAAAAADQQAKFQTRARQYRRLARDAKRNFAGTPHELQRHLPVIMATIRATQEQDQRGQFEEILREDEGRGGTKLIAAIRRILAGERDAELLCENLDLGDSVIIETILAAPEGPSTLDNLLPADLRDV